MLDLFSSQSMSAPTQQPTMTTQQGQKAAPQPQPAQAQPSGGGDLLDFL